MKFLLMVCSLSVLVASSGFAAQQTVTITKSGSDLLVLGNPIYSDTDNMANTLRNLCGMFSVHQQQMAMFDHDIEGPNDDFKVTGQELEVAKQGIRGFKVDYSGWTPTQKLEAGYLTPGVVIIKSVTCTYSK